MILAMSCNN